jgi:hypothetical protein
VSGVAGRGAVRARRSDRTPGRPHSRPSGPAGPSAGGRSRKVIDSTGTVLTVVARTNTEAVTRHKAYGTKTTRTGIMAR